MRLYMIDVNKFLTWVENPEKVEPTIFENQHAVPRFVWRVDSHPEPQMWTNGEHVVRWWFEDAP